MALAAGYCLQPARDSPSNLNSSPITQLAQCQQALRNGIVSSTLRVKLCEICHRKAYSKSKGPLKSIVTTRLSERVQIDLIDMKDTPDGVFVWICHMEDHFSKFHMLFAMPNKEAPTVARHIHT